METPRQLRLPRRPWSHSEIGNSIDKLKLMYKSCDLPALLVAMSQAAVGQAIYVYPLKAQSDEQLSEDRYACHLWAVKESGFDPSQFQ